MQMINVTNLTKEYRDFRLNRISFNLEPGKIAGFIGVNGSGKTTTIRLLLNLAKADAGKIKIFDKDINVSEKEIKNHIGVVMDDGYFFQKLSIDDMKGIIAPAYTDWSDKVFYAYLDRFELSRKQKIESLSKGMKMKFALAIALSHNADLLILDEPSSGLDPLVRSELNNILLEFVSNGENSAFLSTHITSDLDKIADEIIFLDKGNLVFQRSKAALLEENAGYTNIEEIMIDYLEGKRK